LIAFKDFKPIRPGLFRGVPRLAEAQQEALAEANEWIESESIEVIGVESLTDQEGDAAVERRCIRVWYRTSNIKPEPSPEA
jgi:hypothetical protein